MTRRAMAWIGCWLALAVAAIAQEPAANENASGPTPEQAARLQERDELAARAQGLQGEGKLAEAIEVAQQVLAIEREIFGEAHAEIVGTYGWIADMQEAAEDFVAAEKSRQAALDLLTKLHGANDWRVTDARWAVEDTQRVARIGPEGRKELAEAVQLESRAREHLRRSEFALALEMIEAALAVRREHLGAEHPMYAEGLNDSGLLYGMMQDRARAGAPLRQALEIRRHALGESHPDYAESLSNLALHLVQIGAYDQVEPLVLQALRVYKSTLGSSHPRYIQTLGVLIELHQQLGNWPQAIAVSERILDAVEPLDPLRSVHLHGLANLYFSMRDFDRAESLFTEALKIVRARHGESSFHNAAILSSLGAIYASTGDFARAESHFLKALELQKVFLGEDNEYYAGSLHNLTLLYSSMGEFDRAEPLARRAIEIRERIHGKEHPHYAHSLSVLAGLHLATGKSESAASLALHAMQLQERSPGRTTMPYAKSARLLGLVQLALGEELDCRTSLLASAEAFEAARLKVATRGLDRAVVGMDYSPYSALAVAEARWGDSLAASRALEADLARGLLDESSQRQGTTFTLEEAAERQQLVEALNGLEPRILSLVTVAEPTDDQRAEQRTLLRERAEAEGRLAKLAAALSQREIAAVADVQATLPVDAALLAWVDVEDAGGRVGEHWGCVLRASGLPAWERLPGSGPQGDWTDNDRELPNRLRDALAKLAAPEVIDELTRLLAAQRIERLLPHLKGVDRLYVASVNEMAGVPVDVLTDRFTISYTPSGTQLVRLKGQERPPGEATLLALGDPVFTRPGDNGATPTPMSLPPGGLLVLQVIAEGNAANANMESGDVLLTYAGTALTSVQQLGELIAAHAADESVAVTVWRETENQTAQRTLAPGKLGVALAPEPASEAIARRRESDLLLAHVSRGKLWDELPGTRAEIAGLAELFPERVTLLADSDASEQRLAALHESGDLAKFRYLHLATHGQANQASAFESALILAQNDLSTVEDVAAGREFFDGRLTANEILNDWKLNAELVTLSSCESGLGRTGGGEGFLGFAQALLLAGSRSVCLSLWEVDDTATALLMDRFYQNLLGKRDGLEAPLPKAEALAEAKRWLRSLTVSQATELAAGLSHGVARGAGHKTDVVDLPPPTASDLDAHPYEHPYFWAAFVLIGDPQ